MSKLAVNRRGLLTAGLGAAAASAVVTPAIGRNLPDAVVIGAGAFGGWTALELQERGYKTTLVDAYGAGTPHGSSGGEVRNIRNGYGARALYSEWANRAWYAWHRRQEEFGRRLIYPSMSLRLDGHDNLDDQVAVFKKYDLPYEMLSPEEVHKRWPLMRFDDVNRVFLDIHSGGIKAHDAMVAVSEVFQQKGGTTRLGYAVPGQSSAGRLDTVLVNGEALAAGAYVFACGPWLPKVFPGFLGDRISHTRGELFWVGPARGDLGYRWDRMPSIRDATIQTTCDIGGGYKVEPRAPDIHQDPDDGDRMASHFLLQQVNAFVARRLPGLVGRPIISSYVCQFESSNTGDFIIDTHPDFSNAIIAGGGSGHGFKMGPILGPYIADRVAGVAQEPDLYRRFSLAAHGSVNVATSRMD